MLYKHHDVNDDDDKFIVESEVVVFDLGRIGLFNVCVCVRV